MPKLKRGTRVRVKGFEGIVIDEYDSYDTVEVSIRPHHRGRAFWVVVPRRLVGVTEDDEGA